tara:strand:- start:2651 stop:2959 length:309 start_codon:yes stop_codon:yes gene_type:complete
LADETAWWIKRGLGIVPGQVVTVPNTKSNGEFQKIPHIGWNEINPAVRNMASWEDTPLQDIVPVTPFYFVHSMTGVPSDKAYLLADCDYNGRQISAPFLGDF